MMLPPRTQGMATDLKADQDRAYETLQRDAESWRHMQESGYVSISQDDLYEYRTSLIRYRQYSRDGLEAVLKLADAERRARRWRRIALVALVVPWLTAALMVLAALLEAR